MKPQVELQLNLPAEPSPTEWEQYEVPCGYKRAGDVIPIRCVGKIVEIDFDGEMLRATRRTRDRMFVRLNDGQTIDEYGFDRFMSKIARLIVAGVMLPMRRRNAQQAAARPSIGGLGTHAGVNLDTV